MKPCRCILHRRYASDTALLRYYRVKRWVREALSAVPWKKPDA